MAFLINLLDPALIGTLLLREWQIPTEVTSVLEYVGHTELLPAEALPAAHRTNLAVLFLAHCCFDYMTGKDDAAPAFFAGHMQVLNQQADSLAAFVRQCLVPSITARNNTQPLFIRNFLNNLNRAAPDSFAAAVGANRSVTGA
jgi:hypothetical protein